MKRLFFSFWIALNVFLAGAVLLLTTHLPSILIVEGESRTPFSVSTSFGRTVSLSGGGCCRSFTLMPTDHDVSLFVITPHIPGGGCPIRRVSLVSRFFIERSWDASAWHAVGENSYACNVADSRLSTIRPFWLFFAGLQVLLAAFSWLLVLFGRRDAPMSRLDVLCGSLVASFVLCVVTPLQTYLGCHGEFPVCGVNLFVELVAGFVVSCVVSFLVMRLAGRLAFAGLVAMALCIYLETGVLSIGNPTLDGAVELYRDLRKGCVDLIVLVGVSGVLLLLRNTRFVFWTALATLVLSCCSLVDVHSSPAPSIRSDIAVRIAPNEEIVKSCAYSDTKNVSLNILDSLSTETAVEVFRRDRDVANAFDGFVFCTNNLASCGGGTLFAVPAILSGEVPDDFDPTNSFPNSVFTGATYAKPYIERNALVSFMPGSFGVGYTTQDISADLAEGNEKGLFARIPDQQWDLFELSRFRIVPFIVKYYLYMMTTVGFSGAGWQDEGWTYPILAEAPVKRGCKLSLQYWHTCGAHPPMGIDRNGVNDGHIRIGYEAKLEKSWYAFKQAAKLLNALKRRGLYDKTFLVFTADHGGGPAVPSGAASPWIGDAVHPFLMYKALGARGPLRYSAEPTSHAGIAPLFRTLAERDVDPDAAMKMLTRHERHYRTSSDEGVCDIVFGDDCLRPIGTNLIHRADDECKTPLELGVDYSFDAQAAKRPPIQIKGAGWTGTCGPRVFSLSRPQSFRFRVPEPDAAYEVAFSVSLQPVSGAGDASGCTWTIVDRISAAAASVRADGRFGGTRIVRIQVRSDHEGLVLISGTSTGSGSLLSMCVQNLK